MDPPPGGMSLTSACSTLAQPAFLLHTELLHRLCSSPDVTVLTEKSSFTDSDTVGAVKEANVCIATCRDTGSAVAGVGTAFTESKSCCCGVSCCESSEGTQQVCGHPQAREQSS